LDRSAMPSQSPRRRSRRRVLQPRTQLIISGSGSGRVLTKACGSGRPQRPSPIFSHSHLVQKLCRGACPFQLEALTMAIRIVATAAGGCGPVRGTSSVDIAGVFMHSCKISQALRACVGRQCLKFSPFAAIGCKVDDQNWSAFRFSQLFPHCTVLFVHIASLRLPIFSLSLDGSYDESTSCKLQN